MFRHAKYLVDLSSPADDRGPATTDHGDFLYFSSAREGGFGGHDIYRSRISGEGPTAPQNLGAEINSTGDETDPALRMAGFQLFFKSDRTGSADGLFRATSRRMVRKHDYSKMPDTDWLKGNLGWLIGMLASLILFVWACWRSFLAGRATRAEVDEQALTGGAGS